jgi:hypothetical protein
MIGITVNLYLGAFILMLAFILLAYGFWQWETASRWCDAARVSTLWALGIAYFGLVGFQIYTQYLKDHPAPSRSIADAPISNPIATSKSDVVPIPANQKQQSYKVAAPKPLKSIEIQPPISVSEQPQSVAPSTFSPQQTVNAPNGIGTIGGTLINPQVNNFGYMEKTLSAEQMAKISDLMRPFADGTDRSDLISCEGSYPGSITVATQLAKVFREAGWILKGTGFGEGFGGVAPEPLLILINSNGHAHSDGEAITSREWLPAGSYELAKALQNAGISVGFGIDESVPVTKFRIRVGAHP